MNSELQISDYKKICEALAQIYISMYIFDIKANTMEKIKGNKIIDKWADEVDGAQQKFENVMKNIAFDAYVDEIMDFINFSTLEKRLAGIDTISLYFEGKVNGWSKARFTPIDYDDNGNLWRVLFIVEGVNEVKSREKHLEKMAQTDLMTGISNRGFGERCIEKYFEQKRQGLFCLFDVDHFKHYNDSYGHKNGDHILVSVAECMKEVSRPKDVAMRLGGDEFAFFFEGVTTKEEAETIVQKLFNKIDNITIQGINEKISISLGAAFSKNDSTFDDLYKEADRGVYISKNKQGNACTYI